MNDSFSELRELCEAVVEDRLTPQQRERLEQLVLADPQARRFYVEYLHQHACLQWAIGEGRTAGVTLALRNPTVGSRRPMVMRWAIAVAACLLLALTAWFSLRPKDAGVATLTDGKACKWESATLPTQTGARLGKGRLRLAEGLARIVFDDGAEVSLEGPADLEIVSAQRCILHGGRLMAKVPPPAIGFVVDTPSAVLKDLGTEFGVRVHEEGTADVQVFKGIVDARHRTSGDKRRMRSGENLRFDRDAVADFDPAHEQSDAVQGTTPAQGLDTVRLTTAFGRGKDAYVQPIVPNEHSSDILLLVKNTADGKPEWANWARKAYLGFDLAPLAGLTVVEAELMLTFAPTNMGFASEVPDATFLVYGLTDAALEGWDEKTLSWANAPANAVGGAALNADKVVLLGSFEMAQGVQIGTRGISGAALTKFLNERSKGLATLIVVRQTKGSGRSDLVHGFASRRHPRLSPPSLQLTVTPRHP